MRMITLPGLIDPHVHLRTPGQEHKEDFYTGTSSALAGGFTMVVDMPNNKIPITTERTLVEKIKIAEKSVLCDTGFYFGSLGDNLDEFKKVFRKVIGLKLYLNETTGNFLIDKKTLAKIFKAWPVNAGPILVHAEDDAIESVIREAHDRKRRVHFCHISIKSDLEQIIRAKKNLLGLSCGVTPHHLFLTQDDAKRLGPYGRMKPFLKSQKDLDFFWDNLKNIDVIESDHAPHTKEEKESKEAPYGVPGLETALPLLLNAVNMKRLEISDIVRLCHDNPRRIFKLPQQESIVDVDMDEKYMISNDDLKTKSGWSPFDGAQMQGKIKRVRIRNNVVFIEGKIIAQKGDGNIIRRVEI